MALTDYNYNPKGIALNNPMGSTDLFPNKTLVPGSDGSLTSNNVIFPRIDENGQGYEDLNTLQSKYSFDINGVTKVYRKEMYPFQFITDSNVKATSTGGDVHVQAEDRDQDIQFHDIMLNKLRIASLGDTDAAYSLNKPYAIDSASNLGGKLQFRALTTAAGADVLKLLRHGEAGTVANTSTAGATLVTVATPAYEYDLFAGDSYSGAAYGHMLLGLGWGLTASGEGNRCLGGTDGMITVTKIAALLEGNFYKKIGYDTNELTLSDTTTNIFGYIHSSSGTNRPVCTVNAMFNDLCIAVNGSERQLHEVNARVHAVLWTEDYKQIIIVLDMTLSNMDDVSLSTTAANNKVLVEEVRALSTVFSGGFTRLDTHFLLGMFITQPDAIAQGVDLGTDGNYTSGYMYDIEAKQNYCQIVQSPKIKISGTYIASQSKLRLNQAQKMRNDIMMKFKQLRGNLKLYGKGASHRRVVATGDMINTSAGFFCYQFNPIRYARMTLNFTAASSRMESIKAFVINYARSEFAFQPSQQNNGRKTVLISKFMMNMINEYIQVAQQEIGSVYGTYSGNQPPIAGNTLNLNLKYNSIVTPYGTLDFKVEPAFDYLTEMTLPYFVSTTRVNPKFVMMGIEPSLISTVQLRAPRLRGNIQTNSADFTMEDMMCEETLEVLNSMAHRVTLVDIK